MNLNGWIKATLLGASLIALSASAPIAATTTSSPGASPAATPAKAAPPKKTVHHEYTAPAASKPVIDPAALAAMGKMSAFLRSNNAFTVKMSTQRDDVDIFGQNITLDGETNYQVRSPDAFRIDQNEPGRNRLYVYDGKSVTIYDPKSNVYASFPAPGTIRATLDLAADKYGIEVPLDDLFHWDQGDAETSKLTSAHYVGPAKAGGQDADQYAFRQPGVDWQIWIAKGDKPFPLRVVIVASDDPARPQFEANLDWSTDTQFAADTFAFTVPADARSIPIRSNER